MRTFAVASQFVHYNNRRSCISVCLSFSLTLTDLSIADVLVVDALAVAAVDGAGRAGLQI